MYGTATIFVYGLAVLVCLLVCSTLEFEKAGRLAAVALTIIVLIKTEGGPDRRHWRGSWR